MEMRRTKHEWQVKFNALCLFKQTFGHIDLASKANCSSSWWSEERLPLPSPSPPPPTSPPPADLQAVLVTRWDQTVAVPMVEQPEVPAEQASKQARSGQVGQQAAVYRSHVDQSHQVRGDEEFGYELRLQGRFWNKRFNHLVAFKKANGARKAVFDPD
eukprot:754933-Hanusia_phi.AAC.5